MIAPVLAVLLVPAAGAVLLALLPGYRLTARLNVATSLATFVAALAVLAAERPAPRRRVGCCPPNSARGTASASGSPAGGRRASGSG